MELLQTLARGVRVLCGLWVFLPLMVSGQEDSIRIRFMSLAKSTPGGLESNFVRSIAQDSEEYLWLATDRGLSRFDGWETVTYRHEADSPSSLSSDQLTAVAASPQSPSLWVGTASSGLIEFDPRTGNATNYRKGSPQSPALLSDQITDLAITPDQILWIGTVSGLNMLNLASRTMDLVEGPLASANIATVSISHQGELWIGTQGGELYRWDKKSRHFTHLWSGSTPITAVAVDHKEIVWIATAGQGLYHFSPKANTLPQRHPHQQSVSLTSLFLDSNRDLWVGSRDGLSLYDRENDDFIHFRHNPRQIDSLVDDSITSIFEDRSRMLWVTTQGGGTSRFSLDRQWFSHIRYQAEQSSGLPHPSVSAIAVGRNSQVWLGTTRGLALWDAVASTFRPLPPLGQLASLNYNTLLCDEHDNLWMGTRGAGLLIRSRDGAIREFRHDPTDPGSLGHDNVSALLKKKDHTILVGTLGAGLFKFDPVSGKFAPIKTKEGVSPNYVSTLAEDDTGRVWIGTQTGLYLLPDGETSLRDFVSVFPAAGPLSGREITSILPDTNGIIWIGSADAGLDRLNVNTGAVSNFNRAVHALPDDQIVSLVKDDQNLLWVATRNGIARLNAMQNEFRIFSEEDGLQRAGFHQQSVARDAKGLLYFGGEEGFNIINPTQLPALPRIPNPILTSFEYYGEPVIPTEGGILEEKVSETKEIRIPYDRRLSFAFRFGNFDYRFPNRGVFRYRLEGHDEEWILADRTRKASYGNLTPGEYRFLVQSSLDGRHWPEHSAKVRLVITPPWWKLWWVQALQLLSIIAGTVVLTYLVSHTKMRRLARQEELFTAKRDRAAITLVRQLHNQMLPAQPYHDLRNKAPDNQTLDAALQQITRDFNASHCLVLELVTTEDGSIKPSSLKQVGYYSAAGFPDEDLTRLLDGDFMRQILTADHPLVFKRSFSTPDKAPLSILSVKTTFFETVNGIIFLARTGPSATWMKNDAQYLNALTEHFGFFIAQRQRAETEEQYKHQLEEARRSAEVANRTKSEFFAMVTHELRSPLSSIIGHSRMLKEEGTEFSAEHRESVHAIHESSEHLLNVINEILDHSKIEAGRMTRNDEVFEFVPMLKFVYDMHARKAEQKKITFEISTRSTLPGEIFTDRTKLNQTLINLIGNAIKFTKEGTVSLSIRTEALDEPRAVENRLRRRIRIHFEVRDTGCGIHQDEIPHLFERYSQSESGRRSSEGTGLGLPIARDFVQLLGGEIRVHSVPDKGSVFRFYIECDELSPAAAQSGSENAETHLDQVSVNRINGFTSELNEIRILIAEDQAANRLLLRRILDKAGFTLAEVEDGQAVIDKWNEWKPHLIFMDENMPIKKGSEAAREIQSLASSGERPVIISLTADSPELARRRADESGCQDFVGKPFEPQELFSVIAKHLDLDYLFTEAA